VALEKRSARERTREARKAKQDTLKMLQVDPDTQSGSIFKRIQPVWEPSVHAKEFSSSIQNEGETRSETTSFGDLMNDFANEREKATAFEAELKHAVMLRDLASTAYQRPSNELSRITTFHSSSTKKTEADVYSGVSDQDDEFWALFAEVKQTALAAREAGVRLEELAGGLDQRVNANLF